MDDEKNNDGPTLDDWVWVEAMFIQPLIGAISSNIRQILLSYERASWILEVTLARDSQIDQEEANDIVEQFSCYLEDIKFKFSDCAYTLSKAKVMVSKDDFLRIGQNSRVHFRRKE